MTIQRKWSEHKVTLCFGVYHRKMKFSIRVVSTQEKNISILKVKNYIHNYARYHVSITVVGKQLLK